MPPRDQGDRARDPAGPLEDEPGHLDLEVLSAALDEPPADAARAHLAACAGCRARQARLAAAAAAVGSPVPPAPDGALERAVAAALAAADPGDDGPLERGAPRRPDGGAVRLTPRPGRRVPAWAPTALAVAAALALVALAVPLLAGRRGGGVDGDAASSAGRSRESAEEVDDAAGDAQDRSAAAETFAAGPAGGDLGAVDPSDVDAIWARVHAGPVSGEAAPEEGALPCLDEVRPPAAAADVAARATATVDGDPAAVYVLDVAGGRRLLVLALDGCRPLVDDAR